jgi:MFS family permease
MRALARLLAAATLARGADSAAAVVVLLESVARYGSPAPGALALAALMVPHVVAGPFAGILTDRAARPRLVHAGFVAVFGLCLGAVALLLGRVPLAAVLVLAAAAGCCGPMILGGLSSRLDDVTPEARRAQARGLDAATYNVADIAGPATGAALAAALGVSVAAVVLASACLCAALILLTVRSADEHGRERVDHVRIMDDLRAGLRTVLSSRPLRSVTGATCVASFGTGALTPAAVLLGIRAHHPAGGGLLVAAFGAGALVGSLLIARFPVRRWPAHRVAVACLVGCGTALGAVAVAPGWWPLTMGLFLVAGFFDGPLLASVLRVRAAESPARLRTQVFTLGTGLKLSAAALGAAAFTVVAGFNAALVVGLVAATQLVAALAGVALLTTRRGR